MKIILSPAKTMVRQENCKLSDFIVSQPAFIREAEKLNAILKRQSKIKLKKLFKTSDEMTEKCREDILHFETSTPEKAAFAFRGEVFKALAPENFSHVELSFAQENLHIFSGLYGILKPLDRIKLYRLDFNTPLKVGKQLSLKKFWNDRIINYFEQMLVDEENIINLASAEFSTILTASHLKNQIITLEFRETKQNKLFNSSVFAKQARGFYCREIIKKQITDPQIIKELKLEGYRFRPKLSSENVWFFVR
ncbi:MAG: YaaA family protein [Calditrichaeota bacterium]|nr:MAG: YaaA family protein [Calditrichota bacterium]